MTDSVQEIKDRLDIVEFLRPYLTLSPAGKNFKARCPFHKEKTPSFIVSPERQIWHCFGCSLGGDVVGFLMRYENLEFVEALKVLAEKAGIDLQRFGSPDQKKFNLFYEINNSAKNFFRNNLVSTLSLSKGNPALDYLVGRGLKNDTIEEFEIGAAPDAYDALVKHLIKSGFNVLEIEKAGLIFKTSRGTYMDRFRNRIMFPLYNSFGKVVGFTGRVLPGAAPDAGKYVNSPETPIFNKSKLLFGLHKSKNFIRETKTAVLMEGQMDLIMSWQDGVKNAVATSGTALTIEHLKVLKRIADSLILSFDSDEAGQMATERTIDLAEASDFIVKVVSLKDLKDPADIVQQRPGLMSSLIDQSQPAMKYYFDKYFTSQDHDVKPLKNNLRLVLSKIKNIYSPVEKSYWLKELSSLSKVEERFLSEEMEAIKDAAAPRSLDEEPARPPASSVLVVSKKDLICQRIASLIFARKNLYSLIEPQLSRLPNMYQAVIAHLITNAPLPAHLKELTDYLALNSSLNSDIDDRDAAQELNELARRLQLENFKEKQQELRTIIQKAEAVSDDSALAKALAEFDRVSKERQTLEKL